MLPAARSQPPGGKLCSRNLCPFPTLNRTKAKNRFAEEGKNLDQGHALNCLYSSSPATAF